MWVCGVTKQALQILISRKIKILYKQLFFFLENTIQTSKYYSKHYYYLIKLFLRFQFSQSSFRGISANSIAAKRYIYIYRYTNPYMHVFLSIRTTLHVSAAAYMYFSTYLYSR